MKKRVKWIVGAGVLVAAPFISAAPASAGVGSCTTAALGQPIGTFVVTCSTGVTLHCTNNNSPLGAPIDRLAVETVDYALCVAL